MRLIHSKHVSVGLNFYYAPCNKVKYEDDELENIRYCLILNIWCDIVQFTKCCV